MPGAVTIPGEARLLGKGAGLTVVPVPTETLGMGATGNTDGSGVVTAEVGGCRQEYGTSGGGGELSIGDGMGKLELGPTGIGWAVGKDAAGLTAPESPPLPMNNPVGRTWESTAFRSSGRATGRSRLAADSFASGSVLPGSAGVSTGGYG
jgi:hypothetical protein